MAAPRAPRRRDRRARRRVGTRGPGESQLETDRRIARRKISLLRKRLKEVGKHRATRRKERATSGTPTVALAGYTNVGKSTLLNALTGAEVSVENRLFETLDPTTRGFEHEGKRYLVTDTVGFIRRLPTQLVEGFASTLEETLVADLVLHVVDAAEDDDRLEEMIGAVDAVLHEIGADVPVELVLNKIDQVDPLGRRRLSNRFPGSLQISAATGEAWSCASGSRTSSPTASRTSGCCCPTRRAASSQSCRARRADRRARGLGARRARTRPAAAARGPPLRRLSRRRRERRGRARRQLAGIAGAVQHGAPPRGDASFSRFASASSSRSRPASVASWATYQSTSPSSAAMAARRARLGPSVIADRLLDLLSRLARLAAEPERGVDDVVPGVRIDGGRA